MKKRILELLSVSAILVFAFATPSRALLITVTDSAQLHVVGDTFTVDLSFSGLGDVTTPSLSSYDVFVGFDSAILALTNVSFGTALGGSGGSYTQTAGSVQLLETSSLMNAVLDSTQPGAFVGATLTFQAVNIGIGHEPFLGGATLFLTDGTVARLAVKKLQACPKLTLKKSADGTVTYPIVPDLPAQCTQVIAVPEPASFFLFLAGLFGLVVVYRSPVARRARGALVPIAGQRA